MADSISTQNLVYFKRGVQDALPTQAQQGTFYLTTDTNRLYVGQEDGKAPQLLNQTVQIVNNVNALPSSAIKNDFYYCIAENILAVYVDYTDEAGEAHKGWVQINPDTNTFVQEAKFNGGVNEANTAIEYTLTLNYNEEDKKPITASFTIDGSLLGSIVPSDVAVGLAQNIYIKPGYGSAGVTITTTGTGANTQQPINFTNGNDISITQNTTEKEVVINHKTFTAQKTEASDTTSLEFGDEFVVTEDVTAGSNGHITSIVEKKYKLPALPSIPSQEDIKGIIEDELINLDPMRYKGTVNTTTKLPTSNISVGDTYMVSEIGMYGEAEQLAVVGDLFIAVGAENPETGYIDGIVTWTHIPSGNETYTDNDTQYKLEVTADGISLMNKDDEEDISSIQFVSDTLDIEPVPAQNHVNINLLWGTF